MRYFRFSLLIAIVGLAAAFLWGGVTGVVIAALLSVMEVSLSFDNAVVNASVLRDMDEKWQRRFLTWGILIAVFGMRLVFPLVLVAVIAGLGLVEVGVMALQHPEQYSHHLHESHVAVSAFGGVFLLLVFLAFMLDETKEHHWLAIEDKLAFLGKMDAAGILIALAALMGGQYLLPAAQRNEMLVAGVCGVMLYIMVDGVSALLKFEEEVESLGKVAKRSGAMAFLYLEVLDASFSFDGVIGAFAITKDIVIIMLGLAIGAMFVRSLTVYLVEKGTLQRYIYLEHGAHYAIGALAVIMLLSVSIPIPEVVTGLIGVAFIGLSMLSSMRYNRAQPVLQN